MLRYFILLTISLFLYAEHAITPIPLDLNYNEEKAQLGKKLFFETMLSRDGTIACVSCHHLPGNGADKRKYSLGIEGKEAKVNTPTVLNSVFNFTQLWNGSIQTLHQQVLFPIINPKEMNSTIEDVLSKLENSHYKENFYLVFKDGITPNNLFEVIAEFEKALTTPNSKFDNYLRGDDSAINAQEKRGYEKFKEIGCISCHNGVNFGGNMYQKIGLMVPYHTDDITSQGRYKVTKRPRDKQVFKVPTLRNVELTAPYFHDGSIATLQDAIKDMKEHQLGIFTNGSEIDDIEAFLKTLTGDTPRILQEVR